MSKANDGGTAFPCTAKEFHQGMSGASIRDYFAAKALQGILSNPYIMQKMDEASEEVDVCVSRIATKGAFKYADAMLAERSE